LRFHVLLIEDHVLFRESLALLLERRLGLESVETGSLAEGRRVLSDLKCMGELVAIIDVDLPDEDESELIQQLHKTKPDVPVLVFTADQSLV
jgi:DNA-binding NarL/FixJ family response regulator